MYFSITLHELKLENMENVMLQQAIMVSSNRERKKKTSKF